MKKSTIQVDKATSQPGLKLSIVFSFRNEDDVLEELISRVRNVLKLEKSRGVIADHELIFINDHSTDRSEELLKELDRGHGDIKIINMSRNFGVSPCVMTGLKYSMGDAVVYMDSDLQDPPEVISQMLETWQKGDNVDIVHTVRVFRAGETFLSRKVITLGYWILRKTASIDLVAEAGDFKLLSRRAVNQIIKLNEYNPYMRGMVAWVGFNQEQVKYKREVRFAGNTKFPLFSRKVINNFFSSALISFSSSPLQWASIIGLGGIFSSFGMFLLVLLKDFSGILLPDWLPIVAIVLFIGSIQLIGMGILGLYIQTIFIEVKRRPNYIVESLYGFREEDLKILREATKSDAHETH
jgi:dolichol-phosphate mannosyltransferase